MVYLESSNPENKVGKQGHLKLAKEIFDLKLKNIKKISTKGINRIGIELVDRKSANDLVSNTILKNKGYTIFIPYNQVTCKGIIRNVDTAFNTEQILAACQAKQKILEIRRLNRKSQENGEVTYIPTGTILITFAGTTLPREVSIYYLSFKVTPYVAPVTQCFSCLLFGHTSTQCRGKAKCLNCGDTDHSIGPDREYPCQTQCFYCNSAEHRGNSKNCPEFARQKQIKELMTYENLSYYDASALCHKTYKNAGTKDTNKTSYLHLRSAEFPPLPTNDEITSINIRQRRHIANENNQKTKRTYEQVVSDNNKKKNYTEKQSRIRQRHTQQPVILPQLQTNKTNKYLFPTNPQ
ncbi:hypothetical protein NQ317_013453 [Molorchus minor]|uniref:CCHC-type domain-containing protein n=1 Tax=Molorchus minor TaxID=1323400 RepID=A0ABQ9J5Q4_9CUCU|nr:hypothetical protein NQ317_013453 [Molorchus minor]